MIVTKDCYTITDLVLHTTPQNETELVWATITLKDHSKLVVGSFYRPPNQLGGQPNFGTGKSTIRDYGYF